MLLAATFGIGLFGFLFQPLFGLGTTHGLAAVGHYMTGAAVVTAVALLATPRHTEKTP